MSKSEIYFFTAYIFGALILLALWDIVDILYAENMAVVSLVKGLNDGDRSGT